MTLIQAEHIPVIAALSQAEDVAAETLRRNLVVSGLNLSAFRGVPLRIGLETVIELAGPCAPCSRMEAALGHGGYTAMRGHGGWCAKVLTPGPLEVGAEIVPLTAGGR